MADETFKEKLHSLSFSRAGHRAPKVTTDVHDTHTVDVTEHWHDRQDVTVKPATVKARLRGRVNDSRSSQ